MYLTGAIMMAWNFYRTVNGPAPAQAPAAVATAG